MALHTLCDLLTGTQENCASQAFSQLCHPWNCIISLRDSRHGSGSLGRASSLRSVQLKSAGGTRLCPLRGAPRVQTHSPSPPAKVGRTCRYNLGGTPELRGGGGALSCSGVPHKPPLSNFPQAPLHPRARQNSAAQWKFPSGASAGASRDRQKTSLDPARSWGAATESSIAAAGGILCSGESGERGIAGQRGIWGERGWGCARPRPLPALPALLSGLPCPACDGPCLPSLLICR